MRWLGIVAAVAGAGTASSLCAAPLNLPQEPGHVGPSYWSQFAAAKDKWDKPSFFPIGVWLEGVGNASDTAADKAAGLNTYVAITAPSSLAEVRAAGMYVIQQYEVTSYTPNGIHADTGSETVGWMVGDEYDMRFGPGADPWDGIDAAGHCLPSSAKCGYTVANTVNARFPKNTGRFYFQNYGKGVLVWETNGEASTFVNGGSQNTVGVDMYWYTDTDACHWTQGGRLSSEGHAYASGPGPSGAGSLPASMTPQECTRASNFSAITKRLRQVDAMDGAYQPLWCFPEVAVRPEQLQAQVMSCLIAGVNGIVYFNHNFRTTDPCPPTQHALRDPCYAPQRAAAVQINTLIRDLAPVLNQPRLQYAWNQPNLDIRLSETADGTTAYIFVMQKIGQSGSYSLALPAALASAADAQALCSGDAAPHTQAIWEGALSVTFDQESDWCVFSIGTSGLQPVAEAEPPAPVEQPPAPEQPAPPAPAPEPEPVAPDPQGAVQSPMPVPPPAATAPPAAERQAVAAKPVTPPKPAASVRSFIKRYVRWPLWRRD